ncbi:unnamed protein product [Cyclocybe aegerita]|uniref:DUF6534 domain-containing protein n=1 Tax=Cyclocybe aegerita TaxID=1973307 RepID=A0A8S0XQE5_CYCAE|nr:unnamed protein product [Cyclocybe aegerita]
MLVLRDKSLYSSVSSNGPYIRSLANQVVLRRLPCGLWITTSAKGNVYNNIESTQDDCLQAEFVGRAPNLLRLGVLPHVGAALTKPSLLPQMVIVALATEPALMVAVSTPIQFFVAWRIRLLRRSIWIPLVICTLALTSLAGGIFATYQIKHYSSFANRKQTNKSALLWLISGACADLLITVTLSWSLYERKTGVKSSDAVISRIIRLTVQTGLITSVAAVANVITLLALPAGNTLNFIFNITLMKFYGNFLLATLNARSSWSNGLNQPQTSVLFDPSPKNTNHRVGASIGGTAENQVHFLPSDKANYHTIDLPDAAHQRPVNGKVTELSVSIETVTHRKVDPEA